VCHEAHNRKYDKASKYAGAGVDGTYDQSIPENGTHPPFIIYATKFLDYVAMNYEHHF
jgi:hypothetical protein